MTTQKKIDFLIVGTQKSGTSALDVYLRKHPEIEMARYQKEVHFFDDEKYFKKIKSIMKFITNILPTIILRLRARAHLFICIGLWQ